MKSIQDKIMEKKAFINLSDPSEWDEGYLQAIEDFTGWIKEAKEELRKYFCLYGDISTLSRNCNCGGCIKINKVLGFKEKT